MSKTTIAIAVRNGANYLRETLDSIPREIPVLVSDNFSNDETIQICRYFPNVEVIRPTRPLSMLENWDYVSLNVKTKYFRLVGHDDLVNPDSIFEHEAFLEAHPECALVRSKRRLLLNSKFSSQIVLNTPQPGAEIQSPSSLISAVAKTGTNIIGEPFTATLVTSIFQEQILNWGGDAFGMCELETWLRMSRIGKLGYSEISAGTFRVHAGSYSASLGNPFFQARKIQHWVLDQPESNQLSISDRMRLFVASSLRALLRSIIHILSRDSK
jgi:glycosyltransferase involved in cell wall biosynthesis